MGAAKDRKIAARARRQASLKGTLNETTAKVNPIKIEKKDTNKVVIKKEEVKRGRGRPSKAESEKKLNQTGAKKKQTGAKEKK